MKKNIIQIYLKATKIYFILDENKNKIAPKFINKITIFLVNCLTVAIIYSIESFFYFVLLILKSIKKIFKSI